MEIISLLAHDLPRSDLNILRLDGLSSRVHRIAQGFLDLVKTATPKQVQEAIAGGADVNAREDEEGMTALMFAAQSNSNAEVITTLLQAGANGKESPGKGRQPLTMPQAI